MGIHRIIAVSLTALAGLGIGGTTAAAGGAAELDPVIGDVATPIVDPPPTIGELTSPSRPQKSTTCEGTINCKILETACGVVGGTYTGWPSHDRGHDHTHGICTWPWE